jgi:hypothetical protein
MFQIKTLLNPGYTGIRCGVAIQNGVGETPDVEKAIDLKALGYEVTPDPALTPEPVTPEAKEPGKKDKKPEDKK